MEQNKCKRNDFILISLAYASALFYARVERLKRKDGEMSEREQNRVEEEREWRNAKRKKRGKREGRIGFHAKPQ